jgi:hypothetical protein
MIMEGPLIKYMIILILLFDGTLVKEAHEFTKPVTVMECLSYADDHREAMATYREFENMMRNGYYLNDGRGTWQGVICDNKK